MVNCSFRLFPIRIVLQFLSLTKKKSTKKILFHFCFVLDFMQKLNIFSTFLLAFDNHVLPSVRPFSVCAHFARLLNEIRKFPFSFRYFCPTGIDANKKNSLLVRIFARSFKLFGPYPYVIAFLHSFPLHELPLFLLLHFKLFSTLNRLSNDIFFSFYKQQQISADSDSNGSFSPLETNVTTGGAASEATTPTVQQVCIYTNSFLRAGVLCKKQKKCYFP